MSGSFSGDEVPFGVGADAGVGVDAIFQEGRGSADLLKLMESLPQPGRLAQQPAAAPSPVWIA
jgi:hypothetical protein